MKYIWIFMAVSAAGGVATWFLVGAGSPTTWFWMMIMIMFFLVGIWARFTG